MILPSKHLSQDRALLTVGARILQNMDQPKTASSLWEAILHQDSRRGGNLSLSYDGFVLAMDLLFMMGSIELEEGLLSRKAP